MNLGIVWKVFGLQTPGCSSKWTLGIITTEKETQRFLPISAKCESPSPPPVGAAVASGGNPEKNTVSKKGASVIPPTGLLYASKAWNEDFSCRFAHVTES